MTYLSLTFDVCLILSTKNFAFPLVFPQLSFAFIKVCVMSKNKEKLLSTISLISAKFSSAKLTNDRAKRLNDV